MTYSNRLKPVVSNIICSYSFGRDITFKIELNSRKKYAKYLFFVGEKHLASFDTEEKARMYADAFNAGLNEYSLYQDKKERSSSHSL